MTLSITVQANEWASYALVYNRIPFVHTVRVDDIGHDAPAVLHVRLEDRGVALTHPFATELEPDADGSATVDPVQLQVDVAAMSQVAEDVTAQLVVEVHQQDIVTSHRQDVLLGSARTWRTIFSRAADGRAVLNPLATETLAAFVQPNDPSVGAFLDAVRTRLERTTGSGSTQGYQAGPERVDAIVRAIWDEARERGITYSNPPASWSAGQKVRTPEEVLDGRVGTCLDTSVVLAAAIEHAGLPGELQLLRVALGDIESRGAEEVGQRGLVTPDHALEPGDIHHPRGSKLRCRGCHAHVLRGRCRGSLPCRRRASRNRSGGASAQQREQEENGFTHACLSLGRDAPGGLRWQRPISGQEG